MNSTDACSRCGAHLVPDAPEGLCPRCLLGVLVEGQANPVPGEIHCDARPPQGPAAVSGFGDYDLESEVARGGMGIVYRARQRSLNRAVALKMILVGRWASDTQIARFRIEAAAAGRLHHPHIVPVHDFGEIGGQHYLSMPWIEGGNLASRLDDFRRDITNQRSVRLVAKLARAVQYAHDQGILHRDLKPTNILIDPQDEPHVTDFGLAKLQTNDDVHTRTTAILGTPAYMAPEQASGKSCTVDARADIYSLGAILYELLTGRPPFAGATPVEILTRVRDAEPPPPRSVDPRVDRDLETICIKCLDKAPAGRYAAARLLAEDLERWLARRPIVARRLPLPERIWRWSRRNPAAVFIGLLLLGMVFGLAIIARHLRQQRDLSRGHLRQSLLAQAASIRGTMDAGRRRRALEAASQAARLGSTLEARNEAIADLALPDLEIVRRWPGFPSGSTAFALEARHRQYARSDSSGSISIRDVDSDRELARIDGPGAKCDWLRFSPDGRWLGARYVSSQPTANLCIWDWQVATPILTRPLPPWSGVPVEFAADGESVFVGATDHTIARYSLPGGAALWRRTFAGVPAQLACAPFQGRLAVGFNHEQTVVGQLNATVHVVELETTHELEFSYPARVRSMAWHPGGEVLAVGCDDYRVYEEDLTEGRRIRVYERQENPVLSCAYSADGALLASLGFDGSVLVWEVDSGRKLAVDRIEQGSFGFTPAGYQFGFGITGSNAVVWELKPPVGYFEIPRTQLYCSSASFSPDGRWLVLVNPFEDLRIVDIQNRRPAQRVPVTGVRSAWFDRQGRHLITSGHAGLQRWRWVASDATTDTILTLDRPERIPTPLERAFEYAAASPDGLWLALAVGFDDVWLGRPHDGGAWQPLGIRGAAALRFSPDGKLLATVPGPKHSLCVWELPSAQPVFHLSTGATAVAFSGDGRWLLGAVDRGYRLWNTATWRCERVFPSEGVAGVGQPADFAADGALLALVRRLQDVQLVDPTTGTELATLRSPHPSTIQWVKFSPDARHLAVVSRTHDLQVWDLAALRTALADTGLAPLAGGQSGD